MKKKLKKVLLVLGSILLFFLLIIVIASLLFFYHKPLIKGIIEKQIEKRTGIPVTIATLDYELFPLMIEAGGIQFSTLQNKPEVDVFIEKLVFKGDLHRIRKKVSPYFETIEGEGIRIISWVEKSRKKIPIGDILHGLSSGMSYAKKIDLKNSSFDLNSSGQKLILQGIDLTLSSSEAQESFAYSLLCRKAEGVVQSPIDRFQNTIQGFGTLSLEEVPTIEGRFVLTSNRLSYDAKEEYFEEIDLIFKGVFNADKNEFIFPSLEIEIPSFLKLAGPLNINFQDESTLLFRPRLRVDDLSRFFSLVKKHLSKQFDGLELKGSALFEGEARITPALPEPKASIHGSVTLNPSPIKYSTPAYQIDSHVSGNFKVDGFPDNPNISGCLKMPAGSFTGKALEALGVSMDIPFVYDHKNSSIAITSLKASAATLSLDIPNAKLKTDAPKFLAKGVIDLKKRRIRVSQANIELHPFPPFKVEAQACLDPRDSNSFSVQSSGIGFQSLRNFFSFALPQQVDDWEPDGWLDVQIEAHDSFRDKHKVWEVSAKLEAFDVNFHDSSFTLAGESLQPNLMLEGTFDRTFNDFPFAIEMKLSQGETLWKDFYVNWSKMPFRGTISGRFVVPQAKLTDLSVGATIPDFGKIDATGHVNLQEPRSADLKVTASAIQLAYWYSFINQRRAASQTQVEIAGEAEMQIDIKNTKNAFSVLGFLRVKDASWANRDKNLSFQGIEVYLPVHYESNAGSADNDTPASVKGFLNLRKIRTASLDLSPLILDITSQRNGYLIQPFELKILGQKADVGEISVEYGSNPLDFKALTSLSLKDGDLSQLPFSSTDFQLQGKLSVELPLVEISPDQVTTEGQAEVSAFGGNISLENIRMEQPFSKSRTVSCDVQLSNLDLEKVTDSIPFGRVTGIINGEIQNLALSYGQPESFNIRIESEKKKGIPQRFSLNATNDLAILGTGEKTPFSSQSGWMRFVEEFRYKKIGISCLLKNDIFSLRGTIQRKGVEYLVKGSGLFSINVINKQVPNQIRFQDMLNRLKRIGQSKQSP